MKSKILTIDLLMKQIETIKKNKKRIVLCHGCFDLVHLGHIRHFQEAKTKGDVLIVTITPDKYVNKGPDRPFFNEEQRLEFLANIACIDYVAINKWATAVETIQLLKPDIYAKGIEYKNGENDITGKIKDEIDAIRSVGGEIYFTDDITYSSSHLINNLLVERDEFTKKFIENIKKRYSFKDIIKVFEKVNNLKVLIIGDIILDEYHFTKPIGMSSKSANINAKYLGTELQAGGILAIANHVSSFVKSVELFSVMGDKDNYGEFLRNKLKGNIRPNFFIKENSYTVKKTRFIDNIQNKNQYLFEVCYLTDKLISDELEQKIISELSKKIKGNDIVILADFGHYFITKNIINFLENNSKFFAANVQTNSLNYGFNTLRKLSRIDYVSIDEREMRLRFHDNLTPYSDLVLELFKECDVKKISLTLGRKGSMVWDSSLKFEEVPVFTNEVVDCVGAGDAYLSVTSLIASVCDDLGMIGLMGNIAGGLATKYLGNNNFIEKVSFLKCVETLLK